MVYHMLLGLGMVGLLAIMVLFGRGEVRRKRTLAVPLTIAAVEFMLAHTVSPLTSLPLTLAMLTLYGFTYIVCVLEVVRSYRVAVAARRRARIVTVQPRQHETEMKLGA